MTASGVSTTAATEVVPNVDAAPRRLALDLLVAAAPALIPFTVVHAMAEPFRAPKLLLLHAGGILVLATLAAASLLGAVRWQELVRRRLPDMLVGAILLWTVITATFATHKKLAAFALVTAVSAAALFVGARWVARRRPVQVLWLVTIPAAVNATLAILQELKIWNGIAPYEARDLHAGTTALLGNPNDVGSFLVPGLIATTAWILATKRVAARLLLTPLALLMIGGIAASRTRGALLGAAAGLAVLAIVRWRVRALLWIAAAAVVAGLVAAASPAVVGKVFESPVEVLLSGRAMAFASAWRMFTESPLFGVGPGCFVHAYFDHAIAVQPSMIEYAIAGRQLMFGEAHNDHLQLLAETGLIGYALFLASLVTLIAVSRPKVTAATSERLRFARLCGAPLAASLAALGLFQFPLYLAAPLVVFVFLAGLIVGWSEDETAAA